MANEKLSQNAALIADLLDQYTSHFPVTKQVKSYSLAEADDFLYRTCGIVFPQLPSSLIDTTKKVCHTTDNYLVVVAQEV